MINRVVLMGRLVADPELKTTTSGVSVTSFRIAVDRSYVKAGEQRQADFFDIVAWRSTAEFITRHFGKGSLIAVEGQLQSRSFITKDGQSRTVVEVVADNVSFTGERRDAAPEPQYEQPRNSQQFQPDTARQQYLGETEQSQSMPSDDDLPF